MDLNKSDILGSFLLTYDNFIVWILNLHIYLQPTFNIICVTFIILWTYHHFFYLDSQASTYN